jgi:hypothetical protein
LVNSGKRVRIMASTLAELWRFASLALCLLAITTQSAGAQDEYLVRLTEYDRPGDKSEISIDATQKMLMKITQGDQTLLEGEQVNKIRLVAIHEVIRVDARSLPNEVRLSVNEAKLETEDGVIEFLKPGSVLLLRREGSETEYLDATTEQPIEAPASDVLRQVMALPGDEPQPDDVFGTPAKGAVGAVWEADAKRLVEMYKSFGLEFDEANVSGNAKLSAVKDDGGKKILVVEESFTAKTDDPPNVPAGFEPVLASVSVEHTLHHPADYSTGRLFEQFKKTMDGTFRGKAGGSRQGQEAVFRSEELKDARITWLHYVPRSTELPD